MSTERLTVGSLFAGIGGFDLGLERAGFEITWQVEIDPFCRRVLEKHWPKVRRYEDVRTIHRQRDYHGEEGCDWCVPFVDVLCGGFPCQDVSNAGSRAGIDAERSGLWSEIARLTGDLRPRYVLVENVAALLGRGMGRVLGDLAAIGYDAEWDCLPATTVGAPHIRDRVWIVAYPHGSRSPLAGEGEARRERVSGRYASGGSGDDVADTESLSEKLREAAGERSGRPASGGDVQDAIFAGLEGYERGVVALQDYRRYNADPAGSGWWAVEPNVGRVAHGIPKRVDRLRGLGNAIVPQIAEWIGRRILEAEESREQVSA